MRNCLHYESQVYTKLDIDIVESLQELQRVKKGQEHLFVKKDPEEFLGILELGKNCKQWEDRGSGVLLHSEDLVRNKRLKFKFISQISYLGISWI